MKTCTAKLLTGLFLLTFLVAGGAVANGQGIKNITGKVNDASKTATDPIKETRQAVKEIGQVPRDIDNAKRDITRPADDIKREVDGLKTDINSTKNDIDGLKGNRAASKEDQARQDSLAAAEQAEKQAAYEAEKARADSVYQSKLRTGKDMGSNKPEVSTETLVSDESRTVLLPPGTIKSSRPAAQPPRTRTRTRTGTYSGSTTRTRTSTGATRATVSTSGGQSAGGSGETSSSGGSESATSASGASPASSVTRRYYDTPAKRYLERSDFDEETLADLFEAAIWTGPDSSHTARSIDYMLQQYRMDLDEVKRMDPNFDIDRREDMYRKWSGLYYRNTRPLKEE